MASKLKLLAGTSKLTFSSDQKFDDSKLSNQEFKKKELTAEETIDELNLGLKSNQKKFLLESLSNTSDFRHDLYDFVTIIRSEGFDSFMNLLNSSEEPLFDSKIMLFSRQQYESEIINAQFKPRAIKGLYKCSRCGGENTSSNSKQTRSADEPETVMVTCLTCNNRWIAA